MYRKLINKLAALEKTSDLCGTIGKETSHMMIEGTETDQKGHVSREVRLTKLDQQKWYVKGCWDGIHSSSESIDTRC